MSKSQKAKKCSLCSLYAVYLDIWLEWININSKRVVKHLLKPPQLQLEQGLLSWECHPLATTGPAGTEPQQWMGHWERKGPGSSVYHWIHTVGRSPHWKCLWWPKDRQTAQYTKSHLSAATPHSMQMHLYWYWQKPSLVLNQGQQLTQQKKISKHSIFWGIGWCYMHSVALLWASNYVPTGSNTQVGEYRWIYTWHMGFRL